MISNCCYTAVSLTVDLEMVQLSDDEAEEVKLLSELFSDLDFALVQFMCVSYSTQQGRAPHESILHLSVFRLVLMLQLCEAR